MKSFGEDIIHKLHSRAVEAQCENNGVVRAKFSLELTTILAHLFEFVEPRDLIEIRRCWDEFPGRDVQRKRVAEKYLKYKWKFLNESPDSQKSLISNLVCSSCTPLDNFSFESLEYIEDIFDAFELNEKQVLFCLQLALSSNV